MELDVIAVGAHPDDCEIGCGGTLAGLAAQGLRVGIVDL
ncbi:LmbE family protein, partial [bacterium]|nr:LmbE family protein [bacterium]